jgi:hypothetical protein
MATKTQRQQIVHMRMDKGFVKRADDFRFKSRFESPTEAVKWLLT